MIKKKMDSTSFWKTGKLNHCTPTKDKKRWRHRVYYIYVVSLRMATNILHVVIKFLFILIDYESFNGYLNWFNRNENDIQNFSSNLAEIVNNLDDDDESFYSKHIHLLIFSLILYLFKTYQKVLILVLMTPTTKGILVTINSSNWHKIISREKF